MRVNWCVSSWFRIKNTHSHSLTLTHGTSHGRHGGGHGRGVPGDGGDGGERNKDQGILGARRARTKGPLPLPTNGKRRPSPRVERTLEVHRPHRFFFARMLTFRPLALGLLAQSACALRIAPLMTARNGAATMADATSSAPELLFESPASTLGKAASTVVVGRQTALLELSPTLLPAGVPVDLWKALVGKVKPGDAGGSASTMYTAADGEAKTLVAAVLPEHCSRHNSPIRPHAITSLVAPAATDAAKEGGGAAVLLVLEEPAHAAGAACAVARAFPLYSQKKLRQPAEPRGCVRVGFATRSAAISDGAGSVYGPCAKAAAGVRLAARLVDAPPEQLTTTAFVQEAGAVAARLREQGREVTSSGPSLGDELRSVLTR